jgi:hypothetical protein
LKLLKWRTLREKLNEKESGEAQIQLNSKIQGLGPNFIAKIEIENMSEKPLYDLSIVLSYGEDSLQILKPPKAIKMLPPLTPVLKEL